MIRGVLARLARCSSGERKSGEEESDAGESEAHVGCREDVLVMSEEMIAVRFCTTLTGRAVVTCSSTFLNPRQEAAFRPCAAFSPSFNTPRTALVLVKIS